MNTAKTIGVLSLESDRLAIVVGSSGSRGVNVTHWITAIRPDEVDPASPTSVGVWVRNTLDESGIRARRFLIAEPRRNALLKRLRLPRPSDGVVDVAAMVRLQMSRQLTMPAGETIVDFVELNGHEGESIEVLAGAIPATRLAFAREVCEAAQIRAIGMTLRCWGSAAMFREASEDSGILLGISLGSASIEYVLMDRGHMIFSREAELTDARGDPWADADEALAGQAVVEAKRTWMAQRVTGDMEPIDRVAVLGNGELAQAVAHGCADELKLPVETIPPPTGLSLPPESGAARFSTMAPLIGLLDMPAGELLDFAHPRRTPSASAQSRRKLVLGAAAAVVLLALGLVVGDRKLDRLRDELIVIESRQRDASGEYLSFLRDDARVKHLDLWLEADVDWLAHLTWLSGRLPPPGKMLLDDLEGIVNAEVLYTQERRGYLQPTDDWRMRRRVSIPLSGTVSDRAVANALREALIRQSIYGVKNTSPDTPGRFDLELTTDAAAPIEGDAE